MDRAYSVLTIKSVNEERRTISGTATTPSTDRMGDIVEPKGAQFKLPLPLLYQHDAGQPLGHVTEAKVADDGISITAQIAKGVAPFIDEAWALIKAGLVRGLSIGFSPLEYNFMKEGGIHFEKWDWHELSIVTVPANADASIQMIKSLDSAQRAASGHGARGVVRLSPGVPGPITHSPKGTDMASKTLAEQISAFENKRAASVARRQELQQKALDEGRSKTDEEKAEFDELTSEIKTIDAELVDLREMEKTMVAKAAEVKPAPGRTIDVSRPVITGMAPNIEKGVRMARAGMALVAARGDATAAAEIVKANRRWMDQTPEVAQYLKNAAVPAGDTTTSGWASELAYARDMESEFVEYLRPMTILGKLTGTRRVPFNIRYGTQTATSTANWVGQGAPVPVSKPTVSSGSLGIAKASAIVAIDEELARLSSPSAELLVRDDMARTLATFLDVQFVDPNVAASANVSPASITNGVTATAATGAAATNLRTDLATMFTNMARNELDLTQAALIMPPETAINISLLLNSLGLPLYPNVTKDGGNILGFPVITSNSANIPGSPASGRMIILVCPQEILLADDGGVAIDVSRETALQLHDTPTNTSTGSTTATTMVSMFQTHSLALRCTRFINWAKRRTTAVEYIKEAAYAA